MGRAALGGITFAVLAFGGGWKQNWGHKRCGGRRKFVQKWSNRCLRMCTCLNDVVSIYNGAAASTERAFYQENLKTKCAAQLPRLHVTRGKDVTEVLTLYLERYGRCVARHNQLIDEINERESITYGKD